MNPVLNSHGNSHNFNQAQIKEIQQIVQEIIDTPVKVKFWKYKETEKGIDPETGKEIEKVKTTYSEAKLPVRKHTGDSGFDVYTCFDDATIAAAKAQGKKEPDSIVLYPGKTLRIPTGLCCEIPEGYEIQARPRSGCSLNGCVTILGTVDSTYTKHLQIIACNTSNDPYEIKHMDRIGQFVIAEVCKSNVVWGEGDGPEDKGRGEGFGSSGRN